MDPGRYAVGTFPSITTALLTKESRVRRQISLSSSEWIRLDVRLVSRCVRLDVRVLG
jgi:hypothetical protein